MLRSDKLRTDWVMWVLCAVLAGLALGCESDNASAPCACAPEDASDDGAPAPTDTTVDGSAGDACAPDGQGGTCAPDEVYGAVEVATTPPLPGDACPDPPGFLGAGVEAALRTAQEQAAENSAELLDPDVITVVLCGTGSPIPSDRVQSCTAVFAGGRFFVFDAGDGAQRSMEDIGLPITDLDAVFLTHFHSDHLADLGEVISRSWILGRETAVPVYGGAGIERVVDGFNLVYTPDELYRRAHHGEGVFPPDAELPAVALRIDNPGTDGAVVYEEGGVVIRAFGVDHAPVAPAIGYRVEYGGRAVGISGDTVDTAGFRALAQDVDLLVSEVIDTAFALDTACAFDRIGDERNAQILRDIRTYHIDRAALAEVAAATGPDTLVLTHMVPPATAAQAQARFVDPIAEVFAGEVVAGEDGNRFTLEVAQ